jgi:4-amino-4-deoxy-L-arabinose transferase-like glycosyltransferase
MMIQGLPSKPPTLERRAFCKVLSISPYGVVVLSLLIGFVLRLVWMTKLTPVISFEAEYVRVAQNLRAGYGLISSYGGTETMYAPLYSILIAGVSLVTRNAELAAHLVSLILGTLLIVPVFLITMRVYGLQAANLSALLVAIHPLLVARAGSIYTEAVYPTLLMSALYFGIRSLELSSAKNYFLCGTFFGLAYLTRPEAFAYPLFFAFMLCVLALFKRRGNVTAIVAPGLVLAGFVLVASPYVVFLHAHTGQWRLEGKWNINFTAGMRMHSGLTGLEALYGVDEKGEEMGPLLDPERFAGYTPYSHSFRDKLFYMLSAAKENRIRAEGTLFSTPLGEPFALILITLGLFRRTWGRERMWHEIVLGVMVLSILILVLTAHQVEFRYADPIVPLTMPWVANGLFELGIWGKNLAIRLAPQLKSRAGFIGVAAQMCICIPMLVLSFADTRSLAEFRIEQADNLGIKKAGLWLRNQKPEAKRVAAMDSVVPYYSSSILVQFPYAEPSPTLRYIETKNVDFVVLDGHFSKAYKTIAEWMAQGIPDSRAQLVYDSGGPMDDRIEIYRWERAASVSAGR